MIILIQSPAFKKQVKRLHSNQKKDLDGAVAAILKNPHIGEGKKGDLSGVLVYKFKMVGQLILLAYEFFPSDDQIILLDFGSHENFYRDLKKTV